MKKLSSYLFLLLFAITLFLGYSSRVNAESYSPNKIVSQIRTIYTDGTISNYSSSDNGYGTPLYFGSGPTFSTFGIPLNFRILYVANVSTAYTYKMNYNMMIYTPYSSNSTWDSTKIDNNYDLAVKDDNDVTKDYACSVVSTDIVNGDTGVYTTKSISCTIKINKDYDNIWFSSGYFCKDCTLSGVESLGYIPQDSYITFANPTFERFKDNSDLIINQNQTIIDQNSQTNDKLDNLEGSINNSKDEIKDSITDMGENISGTITDNFNSCRDSYNLLNNNGSSSTINGIKWQVNQDGSVNVSGTATANSEFFLWHYTQNNKLSIGNYNITLPGFTDRTTGRLLIDGFLNGKYTAEIQNGRDGNSVNFNIDSNSTNYSLSISLLIYSGQTVNFTYYPQIVQGSSSKPFEPYGEEVCSNKIDDTNDKLDQAEETRKGIWGSILDLGDKIGGFFDNLLSGIINGIKSLFVPSEEELQSLIDEFKETMSEKLGAIYQVSDMLVSVFQSIFVPTERNSCITFPQVKDPMFNKILIEQTDYCFDSLRDDFGFLFTISDMIISLVCTLSFGNMLYKKYEAFIGGDTSDY